MCENGQTEAPKVSIIIPVYNTEEYLAACIESVLHQSYQNLEVIVIDDGSVDGSNAICKTYANTDSRITLIEQENRGVSAARNRGLSVITGDFLFLLDSDDRLADGAIEELVKEIQENSADVVFFNILNVTDEGAFPRIPDLDAGVVPQKELLRQMICYYDNENRFKGYFFSSCSKMYRISSLKRGREDLLSFNESIRILEDGVWLIENAVNFQVGVLDPRPWLHRTIRANSAMGDQENWSKTACEYLRSYDRIMGKLEAFGYDELVVLAKQSYFNSFRNYARRAGLSGQIELISELFSAIGPTYQAELATLEISEHYRIETSESFNIGRKITKLRQRSKIVDLIYRFLRKAYKWIKKLVKR